MFVTPRDLFAAFALNGLLAWSPFENAAQYTPEDAARAAYQHADAMLLERDRTKPASPATPAPRPKCRRPPDPEPPPATDAGDLPRTGPHPRG